MQAQKSSDNIVQGYTCPLEYFRRDKKIFGKIEGKTIVIFTVKSQWLKLFGVTRLLTKCSLKDREEWNRQELLKIFTQNWWKDFSDNYWDKRPRGN